MHLNLWQTSPLSTILYLYILSTILYFSAFSTVLFLSPIVTSSTIGCQSRACAFLVRNPPLKYRKWGLSKFWHGKVLGSFSLQVLLALNLPFTLFWYRHKTPLLYLSYFGIIGQVCFPRQRFSKAFLCNAFTLSQVSFVNFITDNIFATK